MIEFIKLSYASGNPVYIAVDKIEAISAFRSGGGEKNLTAVFTSASDTPIQVTEPVERILEALEASWCEVVP